MTLVKENERTGAPLMNGIIICDHAIGIQILAFSFINCVDFLVFASVKWGLCHTSNGCCEDSIR